MTKETMTLTRALATVKGLDVEISKYFEQPRKLIAIVAGDKQHAAGVSNEELKGQIQAGHDGIENLIKRRDAIKSAIVLKNASVQVKIGNKTVSIAEAIVQKSLLPSKEALLKVYRATYAEALKSLEKAEAEFQKRVDVMIGASISPEATEEVKKGVAARVTAEQRELIGPRMLDSKNLRGKIDDLAKEVNDLKVELDYTLSEINTTTTIDVEV